MKETASRLEITKRAICAHVSIALVGVIFGVGCSGSDSDSGDMGNNAAAGASSVEAGGAASHDPVPCASADCNGRGTCNDTGICSCDNGWSGSDCSTCAVGFSGENCESTPTAVAPSTSVSEGVVPLGVHFDATQIGGLTNDDFLNAHIAWQFGDAEGGAFEATGNDKNAATGFVAAHVFERPGTYEVVATIVDSAGEVLVTTPVTIRALEFSGESRCLSVDGNFQGAPADCDTQTTSDLNAQLEWLGGGSNRRLLLRRGEEWNEPDTTIQSTGPAILGAFGSGASPRIVGSGAITFTGSDVRVMDVEFSGLGLYLWGDQAVGLRVRVHDVGDSGVHMGGDAVFLADSSVENNGYFSIYADGSRLSITGSTIDQIRVATSFGFSDPTMSRNVFVTNNLISASRSLPTTGIKWHSRRGVITDNIIIAGLSRIALSTDDGAAPTPQDEGLGDVLIERNSLRTSIGGTEPENDQHTDCGVTFTANERAVIRNNVMYDMSRAFCNTNEVAPARDIAIHNNTIYKGTNHGPNHDEGDFVWLSGNVDGLRVFNNIVYVNNDYAEEPIVKVSGLSLAEIPNVQFQNNIYHVTGKTMLFGWYDGDWASFSDWQSQGFDTESSVGDPKFQSTDVDAESFLRLADGSPAVDAGADDLPVAYDADLQPRDELVDIGAFETP